MISIIPLLNVIVSCPECEWEGQLSQTIGMVDHRVCPLCGEALDDGKDDEGAMTPIYVEAK